MFGEYAPHLDAAHASEAANVTYKFMNRMQFPYPYYRLALCRTIHMHHLKEDLNKTLGGFIRQEFNLWEKCGEAATDVSEEVIRRVWRRLG